MEIPPDLVPAKAIEASLKALLQAPPPLLPEDATAPALRSPRKRKEISAWIAGAISSSFTPTPQDVAAVSKARHGVRPVALWDLPTRVAYRAIADELAESLQPVVRSAKAWATFQRAPLTLNTKYIVAADIASCYQFIDHGLLRDELLAQTGDGPRVKAVISILRATSGQTYGMPQQSAASDVLAEAFLDRLERAITRKGFLVFRYNDDFRICCDTWSEVVRSIETLSEEARRHGLALNDSKVLTWSRSKYEAHLDHADELRTAIAEEAELDLTEYEAGYDGDVTATPPEADDVELLTSVLVLERWDRIAGKGKVADAKRAEHRALLQLLPLALSALGRTRDDPPNAFKTSMKLLQYEQTMTPNVCNYLLTRTDDPSVLKAFDGLLRGKVYLTNWQTWWLMGPASRLDGFASGSGSAARKGWLRESFERADRLPILRARAAMALARHGHLTADEALRTFDRSNDIVRPTVVAAIGSLKPSAHIERAVTQDSPLQKIVFNWAKQNA